jgi:hypothetical protein
MVGKEKMRKIIALGIMLLFLGMAVSLSAEESTLDDDITINITAGYYGFFKIDIGHGLYIRIFNHNWETNPENVTFFVNFTHKYLFLKSRDYEDSYNATFNYPVGGYAFVYRFPWSFGIFFMTITVECEGKSLTREGIWFGNNVILYK